VNGNQRGLRVSTMGTEPLLLSFLTECSEQKTNNWELVSGDLFGVLSCTYRGEHIKR